MKSDHKGSVKKWSKKFGLNRSFINIFILLLVFGLGLYFGNNHVNFGPDGVFRRSVQKGESGPLDFSGVNEVYDSLKQGFDGQLDKSKLEDGLKAGLVQAAGDPYTEYMNPTEAKDFSDQLDGSFEGIGAELGKDNESVVIISPISGFPAEKAGLKAHDIIAKIDGESAYNITISDAVKKIRGPKGTKVKLQVIRDGKALDFEIMRDKISIPSVKTEITKDNIGIIRISRFGEDTVPLAQKAAQDFKSKNVKGVILDVRGDPGGLLDAAVGVSSLWLDRGQLILEEKRDNTVVDSFTAKGTPVLKGIPTVVLIDGGSASASEITAGALHDNKAATLIGEKSYGKGSVQEVRQLNDGGVLKVTVARWYTPNGINIDKEGIKPDKVVKFTDADAKAKRDPQQDAAIAKLQAQ